VPATVGANAQYDRIADKVGLVPNVRKKDNLYQGICVLAFTVIGMEVGWLWDGAAIRDVVGDSWLIRMIVGALVGLVVGALLSGLIIMVLGYLRHSASRAMNEPPVINQTGTQSWFSRLALFLAIAFVVSACAYFLLALRRSRHPQAESSETSGRFRGQTEAARNRFEEIQAKAERGDAAAQYSLCLCYARGEGVAEDAAAAITWLQKSAGQGFAEAQLELAQCYASGAGVAEDAVEAVKWYRKAAEQGHATAQYNLGCSYAEGEGVTKDPVEGVKWYRKAAEQGFGEAQCNLGVCYLNGEGVAEDAAEAVKWYRKAAEQGVANAQCNLGACYRDGMGVAKDDVQVYKWFSLASAQGEKVARKELSIIKAKMTKEQIAEAQRLTQEFKPRRVFDPAAASFSQPPKP
jgi:TPR repeat protein